MFGTDQVPLVELTPVQDIFADKGAVRVDKLGGGAARIIFAASHKDHNGNDENVICVSVVVLKWGVLDTIQLLTALMTNWHWGDVVGGTRAVTDH